MQASKRRRPWFFLPVLLALPIVFLEACRETKTTPSGSKSANVSPIIADKPLLEGKIEHVSLYPVPNHREDLAISLVVSVGNSGSPSVARGWSLAVNSPARTVPTILEPVHISGFAEMPGTKGVKVDLAREDLVLKTPEVPISKGNQVRGILTYVLPKTSEGSLSNNNTSLSVNFKDSQGKSGETSKYVIGKKTTSGP